MSFDNKFYIAAEAELKDIQQRNRSLLASRENEIARLFPDIDAMRMRLAGTTGKLLRLIAERPEDLSRQLDALEQENLSLQEKIKEELVKHGYPSDYLDLIYTCKKCRDTGTADGRRCECFMDKVRKAAAQELDSSAPMKLHSFSDFSLKYYDDTQTLPIGCTSRELMEDNLKVCMKYAEDFHLPCSGILMYGATGVGKTHLSLSIASAVIEKGYSVVYGSAPEILRKIEKEHFGSESGADTMDIVCGADLLILDDIGAEFESKFYTSALYTILNNRMNLLRPVIISTNLSQKELKERYGDRVYSRMATMTDMPFMGSDVRIQKMREAALV